METLQLRNPVTGETATVDRETNRGSIIEALYLPPDVWVACDSAGQPLRYPQIKVMDQYSSDCFYAQGAGLVEFTQAGAVVAGNHVAALGYAAPVQWLQMPIGEAAGLQIVLLSYSRFLSAGVTLLPADNPAKEG